MHLSPKAFDLLALIGERRPQAVSKEDIRARLWPGTFVSDSSLPSLVSEIREAIANHRRQPRLIRTVHGFGYAFQHDDRAALVGSPGDAAPTGWLVGTLAEIALFAGANVLGREGEGIILLKSSTVSRRHARITIEANGVVVEDLGSKNGTYVNDRRVSSPVPVVDGDQVRIGAALYLSSAASRRVNRNAVFAPRSSITKLISGRCTARAIAWRSRSPPPAPRSGL